MSPKIETLEESWEAERKLEKVLEEMKLNLEAEGINVDEDCRIDMDSFSEVYSEEEIQADKDFVKGLESEWFKGLPEEEIRSTKLASEGERFEIFKTAVLTKFKGEDFIVVRSSPFDDIKHKVDNILVNRKTGETVCAFDEVVGTLGKVAQEKMERVLKINFEGGAKVKYGIRLEKGKIVKGKIRRVPLFYLMYPKGEIKKAIDNLSPDLNDKTQYEEKAFKYFSLLIGEQVERILNSSEVPEKLKRKMFNFRKIFFVSKKR